MAGLQENRPDARAAWEIMNYRRCKHFAAAAARLGVARIALTAAFIDDGEISQ
jgi:hypothetical protein